MTRTTRAPTPAETLVIEATAATIAVAHSHTTAATAYLAPTKRNAGRSVKTTCSGTSADATATEATIDVPHALQKRLPSGTYAPQPGQVIRLSPPRLMMLHVARRRRPEDDFATRRALTGDASLCY